MHFGRYRQIELVAFHFAAVHALILKEENSLSCEGNKLKVEK